MTRFEAGGRFEHLEIIRELGRGAFGRVWLARDPDIRREVALKVVALPGGALGDEERERSLREAQMMGRLQHPHIATLFKVHELQHGEGWAFEMEYLPGGSLEERLRRRGALPPDDVRTLLRGMLEALTAAHGEGVVHGDIKPANVLFARDGAVKLVDFGLARPMGEITLRSIDSEGVAGTPQYMAPEVMLGERPTEASDLWSLGVTAFRMLTGRFPFPSSDLNAWFAATMNAPPSPLDAHQPADLRDVVERCLRTEVARRESSARRLLETLGAAPAEAGPPLPAAAPAPARAVPGIVGRREERRRLLELAAEVEAGTGRCALVSGEAGMGKSLLAEYAAARAAEQGFRWIETSPTELGGLLRPLLSALESSGFGRVGSRVLSADADSARLETREEWSRLLEGHLRRAAARSPFGLLVDEAHRLDARDRALIMELARRLRDVPVFFLLLYRTHDPQSSTQDAGSLRALEDWRSDPDVVHVHLGPMSTGAMARMLALHADGARFDPPVADYLLRVSEGNPLFALELLRHLEDQRAVLREGARLREGSRWGQVTLPHRLRDLVALRIQDLDEEDRALLDVAAVDGPEFDGEALAAAMGMPLLHVLRGLQRILRRTALIAPRTRGYRFANGVVQEAIYEEIAPDLRRALHRSLAEHLERRHEREPVDAARVAVHWARPGDAPRARPWFEAAAAEAVRRQENDRAIRHAERAGLLDAGALDDPTPARVRLLASLVHPLDALGRDADAERILAAVSAAAAGSDDEMLKARVWWITLRRVRERTGRFPAPVEEIAADLERMPEGYDAARGWIELGHDYAVRGDLDAGEALLRRADAIAKRLGLDSIRADALERLAIILGRRNRHRAAEALHADAARIRASLGFGIDHLVSELNRMLDEFELGAIDDRIAPFEEMARTLLLKGARPPAAHAFVHLATVELGEGRAPRALALLDEAFAVLEGTGAALTRAFASRERAYLRALRGELGGALEDLAQARELADASQSVFGRMVQRGFEVQIRCFLGDRDGALAVAREIEAEIARGQPVGDFQPTLVMLGEGVVFGLPPDVPGRVARSLWPDGPPSDDDDRITWDFAVGVSECLRPGADRSLAEAAVQATRSHHLSVRVCILDAIGEYLRARHAEAEGARDAAAGVLRGVLSAAERIGHRWLEVVALRDLARLEPGEGHPRVLAERVGALAERAPDPQTGARIRAAWSV